ncbi:MULTISPECIES: hypothetical protein [Streptomyces]|jgi:hypothetical protein|uniref:hypothetical protein n=1 Tax=Streptomyces TaxID=1883 RepID=UPI00093C9C41|nr:MULTISPECIES: hypothetical protein [Streptomyces]MBX9423686.1 BrnA antitoxin family protein [Streptomyces lateritius]OKJ68276.1 hypothetical protein AMK29_09695 [Streptomyces sp. CB02261]
MGSTVLSLRIDGELLDRLRSHAARRGMSVQDYVVRTLIREDFDERFQTAVDETERFYGEADGAAGGTDGAAAVPPHAHVRPSAGIA